MSLAIPQQKVAYLSVQQVYLFYPNSIVHLKLTYHTYHILSINCMFKMSKFSLKKYSISILFTLNMHSILVLKYTQYTTL